MKLFDLAERLWGNPPTDFINLERTTQNKALLMRATVHGRTLDICPSAFAVTIIREGEVWTRPVNGGRGFPDEEVGAFTLYVACVTRAKPEIAFFK